MDSLKSSLLKQSDRNKIETYLNISKQAISRDSAIFYLRKALKTAIKINFDSIYPIQFGLSASYYVKGDLLTAKKEIKNGFKSYKFTKDPDGTLGHINMLLGVFSEALNETDSARFYYDKVLLNLKNKNTNKAKEVTSTTYTNYANLYLKSGDYKKAIPIYIDASKLSEKIGDIKNQLISLNNIAGCFKELKKYDTSLEYYNQALLLAKKSKDIQNIGAINLGIGQIHMLKKDFNRAMSHFNEAKKKLEPINFKNILTLVYQNLAEIYLTKSNISEAKFYSQKAITGINEVKDDYSKVSVLITSASIFKTNREYRKALNVIEKALNISKNNNYQNLKKECLKEKINILRLQNKWNQLPSLYENLILVKDSIYNTESIKVISEMETKYKTEKKEKENLQLKAEKVKQELVIEKEKQQKSLFIIFLAIALAGLFTLYKYAKYRKKQLLYISQLNIVKAKQLEQEEIGIELHDNVAKKLEIIEIKLENDGKITLAKQTKSIKNEIRKLSRDLSHISFKESPFEEQIDTLAATYQNNNFKIKHTGLEEIDWEKIEDPIKYNLFLVIRESISNSHNHSNAKNVYLNFNEHKKTISISIKDNGNGFDKSKTNLGSGFRNMKIRIDDINGELKITSKKNKGTLIAIQFVTV